MSLDDMVENESVSRDGAEVLRTIARGGRSFLVHALPQNAGKTTMVQAILAEAPPSIERTDFYGTEREVASLSGSATRGYLVVAEMGHHGRPGYLAGEEVPRVFELVAGGYSLASSLHADSIGEVFDVLSTNGVLAEVAASIPYLIKVRMLRNPPAPMCDVSSTRSTKSPSQTTANPRLSAVSVGRTDGWHGCFVD